MEQPLPRQFAAGIDAMGAPQLAGLIEALDTPALTAVRVNALKGMRIPDGADPVAWCPTGYYPAERPRFTLDPAMHQGLYYVQEASSMIQRLAVATAVSVITGKPGAGDLAPLLMLDACAAPGGKTMCAVEALPPGSVTVANELSPARAAVLTENIMKHGSPDVVITCGDGAAFGALGPVFDIIAVDAPCSGEGMMRKEPVARSQWSPALVADCAALQQSLTDALWEALKPGGVMIYSTCTFNRHENEEIIGRLAARYGAEGIDLVPDPEWNIAPGIGTTLPCMRFIPGLTRGEGLFMALLRKPGRHTPGLPEQSRPKKGTRRAETPPHVPDGWLDSGAGRLITTIAGDTLQARPVAVDATARMLADVTRVRHAGIEVASVKAGRLIPAQGLAMSAALGPDAFARVEVDTRTALDYLRRLAVSLPDGTPRGHILLTHGGHPLGFVNNLGARANNLYPQAWRILTTRT